MSSQKIKSSIIFSAVFFVAAFFLFAGNVHEAQAANCTVTSSANWSAITTCNGTNGIPASTDNVTIKNGATVTVDVSNGVAAAVNAGGTGSSAGAGTLLFNSGSQVTVGGTVTVAAGAQNGTITMTSGGTLIVNAFAYGGSGGSPGTATFTQGTGTVQIKTTNTIPSFMTTFNNLTINHSGGTTTLAANTTVSGTLTFTAGTLAPTSSFTLTLSGTGTPISWTAGGFSTSAGTVKYSGNGATVTCDPGYYNLQLYPSSSSAQTLCTTTGKTLTVSNNLTIGDATNAGATGATNNPTINVTGSLTIAANATFTTGTGTITLSGTAPLSISGTLTVTSGNTIKYSGNGANVLCTGPSYYNLQLYPSSSTAQNICSDNNQTLTVTNDLTIGNGTNAGATVTGNSSINTVTLTIAANATFTTGTGTITLSGTGTPLVKTGTLTATAGGTVNYTGNGATITAATYATLGLKPGGASAQVLSNGATYTITTLNVGDATNAGATGATNNPTVNVSGVMTIAANATYTTGTGTLTLSSTATPLSISGTLTVTSGNTIKYSGNGATVTCTGASYYNLQLYPSSSTAQTICTGASQTLTVTNNLTVGDATNAGATGATYNPTINTVTLTIAANATFTTGAGTLTLSGTGTPLTITGTLTVSGNTIKYSGNGATVTCTGASYYNLQLYPSSTSAQTICTGASQTLTVTNLTVGDGTNAGATGATNNPTVNVSGVMTIAANATYTTGTGTLKLSGPGTVLVKTGTLTATAGGTVNYTGDGANVTAATYATLGLKPLGENVQVLLSGTFNITTLNVGDGTNAGATAATNNPTINVSGTVTIAAGNASFTSTSGTLTVGGSWSNAGVFTHNNGNVTFNSGSTATINGGATTFYDLTITHTAAKEVNFSTTASHIIHVTHTFTVTGHAAALIKLYSTSGGTKWHFHPTGTASADYIDIKDGGCESGSITITPTNSTNSLNNDSCWSFPVTITVSGNVYQDEAGTPTVWASCDHTTPTNNIGISVAGATKTNGSCNSGTGAFSFSVSVGASNVIAIFLDTGGGDKGVTYVKAAASPVNITGLTLTKNRITINGSSTITNANINVYDQTGTGDADIPVASDGTDITGDSGVKLLIKSGSTFTPGGNVTVDSMEVIGTYTAGSGTLTLQGSGTSTTCTDAPGTVMPLCINGGSWGANTSTVNFTGTGATTIEANTYYNLGVGTTADSNNVTFTMKTGGASTVTNVLTVGASSNTGVHTLDMSNLVLNLSGTGTPLVVNSQGAFTASTSTVNYIGNGATVASGITYNHLGLKPGGATKQPIGSGTLTVNGTLTIGNGTNTGADASVNNNTINLLGDLTIAANATYTKGSGTTTFKAGTTQTWTDSTSGQDLGTVVVAVNGGNTTVNLSGSPKATGLTVDASQTLSAGSATLTVSTLANSGNLNGNTGIIIMSGTSTPFTNSGTFTYNTGTIRYTGNGATGLLSLSGSGGTNGYYNLDLKPSSSSQQVLASGTIQVNGALTVGDGTNQGATAATNDPIINVTGATTIAAGATLTLSDNGSTNYTFIGDLTVNGTLTSTGSGLGTITANGNVTGSGAIALDDSGGTTTFEQRVSSGKNFGSTGGSSEWKFIYLTFSNSNSGATPITITTQTGGTGVIAIKGTLAIGKAGDASGATTTLDAGNRTWQLGRTSGSTWTGNHFSISSKGLFSANTSAFNFESGFNETLPGTTYYNLGIETNADTGAAAIKTLGGNTTVSNTLTVGNAGSTNTDTFADGGYTLTLSGTGTPLSITAKGAVTLTGTTNYTGNGATVTSGITYNNLGLKPGGATKQPIGSGTLTVNGTLTIGDGTNTGADASVNNNTINLLGNMTIAANATYTKGSGTTTFKGTTAATYTDNTATPQNLGIVSLNKTDTVAPSTNNKLTLASSMTVDTMTVNNTTNEADYLDLGSGGYTFTVANVGATAYPFVADGGTTRVIPGNSTVVFTATNSGGSVYTTNFPINLYSLVLTGNETYILNSANLGGDLTINTNATLDMNGVFITVNGNVTGAGAVITPTATSYLLQRVAANKNFGPTGNNDWTFTGLYFENSSASDVTITTNAGGSGKIIVGTASVGGGGGYIYVGKDTDSNITTLDNETNDRIIEVKSKDTTVPGEFYISSKGNLLASSSAAFTIEGDLRRTGSFSAGSGTVTLTGINATEDYLENFTGSNKFYNLIINSTAHHYSVPDTDVANNFTITAGTVDLGGSILTIGGNFSNSGTFTHNSGTVIFNDSSKISTISGTTTFYGLTVATADKTVKFTAGTTYTIDTGGLLTLTGTSGHNVIITSDTGTTSWTINHQGTESVTYTTVSWGACSTSPASTTIDMTGTGNSNGGNNGSCWSFTVGGPSTGGGGPGGGSPTGTDGGSGGGTPTSGGGSSGAASGTETGSGGGTPTSGGAGNAGGGSGGNSSGSGGGGTGSSPGGAP